ncbi:Putative cyclic nucleotide binding protein [Bradyrhizobium sp. ORS 285]|uniref:Crp/Fnr family transcriptional regulator n=1 Tax=Bradyrhizobium sp. ORS 285 TaxID=115808 RepID=UPI0002408984|nr:cyclic nucleotide-binding domain-containing protein [Bradyrhizobium sp. ORS 285]CCD85678.1 putative cyclic nucleotide binding protein [Bradyrhizobium sp. ORS 285]SMX58991.1 Putative cyclic nucleotide binding protein [Bradyrhizobium sp. ORS 285]
MTDFLRHCTGGAERTINAGVALLEEGGDTGHLYILLEGRLEVIKAGATVAVVSEPGALFGEMSLLLEQPHTATVRALTDCRIYEILDAPHFLAENPEATLAIARMLAQRLNVANTYLADLKRQYAGHGTHLAMVGDVLQSMINLPPQQVAPGTDLESDPRL